MIAGERIHLDAPGLKVMRRPSGVAHVYWVASEAAVKRGYHTKTRRIFVDLDDPAAADQIREVCQIETAAMLAWLDDPTAGEARRLAFDGTLRSLVDLYERDPDSSHRDLKSNTAISYGDWLKVIRATVGARRLDRLRAVDFRRWYKSWKAPATDGAPERVRRAYGCIQALRIVLAYGIEIGNDDCRRLRRDMEGMRFAKNPPREDVITFDQVSLFVETAFAQGELELATAQALQFECMLRQGDVIGSWRVEPGAYVLQPGEVRSGARVWRGLTWDRVSLDLDLRIRTSKTGQPVVHSLGACQLVVRCLRAANRPETGPVAARHDGTPWPDHRGFGKAWRKIADAAGLPKNLRSMDSRAGGISEAAEAGASADDIARSAAHAAKATTRRVYMRLGHEASKRVNESRGRHRGETGDPSRTENEGNSE